MKIAKVAIIVIVIFSAGYFVNRLFSAKSPVTVPNNSQNEKNNAPETAKNNNGETANNNSPANPNSGVSLPSGSTIDLSGKGLTEFPKDVLKNRAATKLILSNNNLVSLPSEIGELTNLTEIYLDNNRLEGSLVAEIRKMSKLRVIDASNNNLTGIPAEIGQLKNLKTINFSNNGLDTMPNEIENLKDSLEILNLSGNKYNFEKIKEIEDKLPDTQVIF